MSAVEKIFHRDRERENETERKREKESIILFPKISEKL